MLPSAMDIGIVSLSLILANVICVYSECSATYYEYCLSGVSPGDHASFIAARYEYKGQDEGCKYFENVQLPGIFDVDVYLHWDTYDEAWYIGSDVNSSSYWAYCIDGSLDSCTTGRWSRYDGSSTVSDYSMTIAACSSAYDNNVCLNEYNNTFGKRKHNEEDFCIRNTTHLSDFFIANDIAASFSISGCFEEKVYYTSNNGAAMNDYEGNGSITTIAWDNEMSVWHMYYTQDVVAWGAVAYCFFDDIANCSNNWYIRDGQTTSKDSAVVSGLCNSCTDTKHDTFCIYGGVGRDDVDSIVGIYEYDTCVELMHSYKRIYTTYEDYDFDNETLNFYNDTLNFDNETLNFDGDLTIHYYCSGHSWRIDVDYDRNKSLAWCDEMDDIMQCSGNWMIFDEIMYGWNVKETIKSGSCDIVYNQCFNSNSAENEQYLCITDDGNDGSVALIAGEFKYLECDEEGFPIYVRHRDNNGNYLNETWDSMITWDSSLNVFKWEASQHRHWLYCRSLLIELCDTFWNLILNDEWTRSPSIRLTKQKCNYAEDIDENLKPIAKWVYFVIAAVLVLCCMCCLFYYIKDKISTNAGASKLTTYQAVAVPVPAAAPSFGQQLQTIRDATTFTDIIQGGIQAMQTAKYLDSIQTKYAWPKGMSYEQKHSVMKLAILNNMQNIANPMQITDIEMAQITTYAKGIAHGYAKGNATFGDNDTAPALDNDNNKDDSDSNYSGNYTVYKIDAGGKVVREDHVKD